jgi:hypothetical protein
LIPIERGEGRETQRFGDRELKRCRCGCDDARGMKEGTRERWRGGVTGGNHYQDRKPLGRWAGFTGFP